ncbi:MAG TPA: SIMPL domain-containing protein [Bacteroidales bacterium]|jgi:uncharacterized protein YggE|nr:SIMPL domain-containing protein [Bacteroidales bacterium]
MKKLFVALIMIFAGVNLMAQSAEKNFIDQPYIEVTGTAELEVVPDMIYLRIVLNESDTKGKISLSSLERKMKERLSALGIDVAKDLTVEDLSSNFTRYFLKEKEVTSSKRYVLLVHDAATAGKAIQALGEEEISNISIIKIDHSQMAQKRFDLRLEAVKAAQRKAQAMAECIGQHIGKAIYISEENAFAPYVQSNVNTLMLNESAGYDNQEPELTFKNIYIKSSANVKFILN